MTTLPSKIKTWVFSGEGSVAAQSSVALTNQATLFKLKQQICALSGPAWTVVRSSDSVSTASSDLWLAAANLVWNATTRSWAVFRSAAGIQMLIDLNASAATSANLTISISGSVGFTGGNITTAPTASDSQVIISAGTWTTLSSIIYGTRTYVLGSTDGTSLYWVCTAGGAVRSFFCFQKPASVNASWTTPAIATIDTTSDPTTSTFDDNLKAKVLAVASSFALTGEGTTAGLIADNSAIGQIQNEVSGGWNFGFTGFASTSVGSKGVQGRFNDLWLTSSSIKTGQTFPTSSPGPAGQFLQIGSFAIPWDNGAFNLSN
jgi:hypothetical protein